MEIETVNTRQDWNDLTIWLIEMEKFERAKMNIVQNL